MKKTFFVFFLFLVLLPHTASAQTANTCTGQSNCLNVAPQFTCETSRTLFTISVAAADSATQNCRVLLEVYKLDSTGNQLPATKKTRQTDGLCNTSFANFIPQSDPGSYQAVVTRYRQPVNNPSSPWAVDLTNQAAFSVSFCPTPTLFPFSSCTQIQALNPAGGVITNPSSIRVSDIVTFRSFWSVLGEPKKTIRYNVYLNNLLQPIIDVPATLGTAPNGQSAYQGDYTTTVGIGNYKVVSHDILTTFNATR